MLDLIIYDEKGKFGKICKQVKTNDAFQTQQPDSLIKTDTTSTRDHLKTYL